MLCHTCADDAVLGELLGQRLHVGVTMGVQLPAGDAQVEAQPRRMAVTAAVPLDVLVFFLASTDPGNRRWEEKESDREGKKDKGLMFISLRNYFTRQRSDDLSNSITGKIILVT